MKILIVRPSPDKVDPHTYNLQEIGLAKALTRRGHHCDVMYYCGKEKDHYETVEFDRNLSIRVLWLHGYGFLREGIYPSLRKYVQDYDIIQVGGYTGLTSCWLNRYAPDKVINYQGPYYCADNKGDIKKAKVFDKLLLPLSHKKNMIVATKSVLATRYIESKGIKNVFTIGVGLDLDNIIRGSENSCSNEFIELLQNKDENEKYLLYVGVLEERRNILFLLRMFKKICEKKNDVKLVLIGKGKPEYVKQCFDLIEKLNLQYNIIYKEKIEQNIIQEVYKACDAFLLPTRYEIFGMVLLEAMYYGLPVFTTYNGGSSTLMNNSNGIVIQDFDEELWSEKIVSVLNDPVLCTQIGTEAHQTIVEKYTWDALADKFLEIYHRRLT